MSYLDHNATAPLRPAARVAMEGALDVVGNPSSVHRHGRAARTLIERARRQVADLLAVPTGDVVFTSGGTEAANLALAGTGRPLLVSAVEHDAVRVPASRRPDARTIPVDGAGRVDLSALGSLLASSPSPALVAVMAVNNETGVVQPLDEVLALAREHDALVFVDAVQAVGRIPVPRGADLLAVSGHKLGGPAGVGALVVSERVALAPLVAGGGQERRRRAGTENLIGIAGFGAAAAACAEDDPARVRALRDGLEAAVRAAAPEAVIFGAGVERVGNTSCIGLPGRSGETQVMALDLAGVSVSAGSACSSGKVGPSHVLAAMGVPEDLARCAIRVSLGWSSTAADVDAFLAAWTDLRTRTGAPRAAPRAA